MKGKLKIGKNKGFTLAELLIVVAIIAVLVAVSIPIFTGRLEKARIATTEANVRSAKAAAIADWMDTAKIDEDNFEESFLASAKKLLTFDLVVYAANSLCYEGSGVRVYVYDGEKNILVENSLKNPSISAKSGKLYTKVAVEINLETGAVRTNPYLTGTGENREVNTGFGTNSFEDEAEPEPSGGHGSHSGG